MNDIEHIEKLGGMNLNDALLAAIARKRHFFTDPKTNWRVHYRAMRIIRNRAHQKGLRQHVIRMIYPKISIGSTI